MSTIGSKNGWRAGGDKGSQQFNLSEGRWEEIFGDARVCTDKAGCLSCPKPAYCAELRAECLGV